MKFNDHHHKGMPSGEELGRILYSVFSQIIRNPPPKKETREQGKRVATTVTAVLLQRNRITNITILVTKQAE